VAPADAFLAGLLHDLGHMALFVVLPRTFAEVCEWAESRHVPLDDVCRRMIGLSSRDAGRRLGEHWDLPEPIVRAIGGSGTKAEQTEKDSDPKNSMLAALVNLADAIARRQHIAPLGHGPLDEDLPALAAGLAVAPSAIAQLVHRLHDEVSARAAALGMDATHSTTVLLRSISRANESLSRLALTLQQRNRTLMEARDELARSRTLASIAEIAAGAAHEMNNPLTVISGRAQVLQTKLDDSELNAMARTIGEQAHQLSDLISALRLFAEPCRPKLREVDLTTLLRGVINEVRPRTPPNVQVGVDLPTSLPRAILDGEQLAAAVRELVCNALEAKPRGEIVVRVQTARDDDRLMIVVEDDGPGLTAHALAHAFDPFFSAKPAGRQPGLGLPRAQRYIEAHGGTITLENAAGKRGGAVATIQLPNWRGGTVQLGSGNERQQQRRAVA
jgi:signal transduction histidine kinase